MPTGYTACILEGADFKTFATRCMRAFGALMHMRDDPLEEPYRPRTPSKYYEEKLKEAQTKLAEHEALTPEGRLAQALQAYHEERISLEQQIAGCRSNKEKLDGMLRQVEEFHPPSQEHAEFKQFMIEQIHRSTSDGNSSYFERELKNLQMPISIADGEQWFQKRRDAIVKEIAYYTDEAAKDALGCKKQNEWARQALQAIEQTAQTENVRSVDMSLGGR